MREEGLEKWIGKLDLHTNGTRRARTASIWGVRRSDSLRSSRPSLLITAPDTSKLVAKANSRLPVMDGDRELTDSHQRRSKSTTKTTTRKSASAIDADMLSLLPETTRRQNIFL